MILLEYFQFWQQYNHPIELTSKAFLDQKLNYIHENPIRGDSVNRAEDPKRVDHIFGDRAGHLPNTPENVQLLENPANNKLSVLGPDEFGNQWSEYIQADGGQIWTQAKTVKL